MSDLAFIVQELAALGRAELARRARETHETQAAWQDVLAVASEPAEHVTPGQTPEAMNV